MNNYCPLIYHGIYVERFSNGTHSVSPCCLSRKSIPFSDAIDFSNNLHLSNIRNENKNNLRPLACKPCWELEDRGGESKRQVSIDLFKNNNISLDYNVELVNLDYNTLPLCNAKCVICGPRYSSTWAAAVGRSLKNILANNHDHINGIDLNNVKIVYFNGGEPLLTDEHLTVLKKIKNLPEVEITYNTNGSCYPSDEAIDIWARSKSVTILFSIDGIKERFEETRTPLKWDIVSANIQKIYSLKNIKVQCSYTIGRHNVYDLEDTIKWFETLPGFDAITQFHVHYVNPGHGLDLKKASADEKQQFKTELSKFTNFYWHESITKIIES